MVNSCLGTGYTAEDLLRVGERIWNLERQFNHKAGLGRADDTLPDRFTREPLTEGPAEGQVNRLDEMLPEYYRLRGWDEDGHPTAETLYGLGLEE
jgi:aldehyde:ferredoxin oxidoreductase